MRFYFAGNVKGAKEDISLYEGGVRNRLLSFAEIDTWATDSFRFWLENKPPDVTMFLDSGAFGAWSRKVEIDFDRYCSYLTENALRIDAYAVLDVIGNEQATRKNFLEMRSRGLDPVPVYHADREGLEVLRLMLDESRYIALGGMVSSGLPKEDLQAKLDRCWTIIAEKWPVRVHGLGLTAQWAVERYPFYSVDSASAIVSAGMGRVMRFDGGRLTADGWKEDLARTYDGEVADGISSMSAKAGSAHSGRRRRNTEAILALERHVTDLWAIRGVRWDS